MMMVLQGGFFRFCAYNILMVFPFVMVFVITGILEKQACHRTFLCTVVLNPNRWKGCVMASNLLTGNHMGSGFDRSAICSRMPIVPAESGVLSQVNVIFLASSMSLR